MAANRAGYRGIAPMHLSGTPLPEMHDDGRIGDLRTLIGTRERVLSRELRLPDGTLLSCDCIPVVDNAVQRGYVVLCRDVTAERRAERAKSEFVSLASHQLRTPLTRIRWAMGRLDKTKPLTQTQQELIDVTKASASVMAETIDVMLTISRMEAGKVDLSPKEVSLRMLLQDLRDQCMEDCMQRSLVTKLDCPPNAYCMTDKQLLNEILLNLLRNAVKYTPSGGVITIRAAESDHGVRIDIEDTGIGIPSDEQHKVFQKFFRAQNALAIDQSGVGLGLYLVHTAAALLGAHISFVSSNTGTVFSLVLPNASVRRKVVSTRVHRKAQGLAT